MSSINNKFLILITSLIFSAVNISAETVFTRNISASPIFASSNLTTDKSEYIKGETVTITGNDFVVSETVSVSLEHFSNSAMQNIPLMNWNIIADEKGSFTIEIPFDSLYSESGRFTIKAFGTESKNSTSADFTSALPNPSANLDQCGNGPFSAPAPCAGNNWQNGNVGQSQGHYYEGDSIPYRMLFDDLTIGAGNPHTVTIEWDTTQGGKHAIDYLTTYNRTESVGNNPCSGVTPACGAVSTFPIPLDSNVSSLGVTQIGGQSFTMWGGTITGVSAYTLSGSYSGNSSTRISITFTANQANPVLAWSGHIADRNDWAIHGGSASDISGSPYHTRLIGLDGSGGSQDRSLSNVAVRLNTRIIIFTQAAPQSLQNFGYSTTNPAFAPGADDNLLAPFTLIDDGVDNDATPNNITFGNLLAPNTAGLFTVTQNAAIGPYSLVSISCSTNPGGTSSTITTLAASLASITLQYGDTVTCTYNNAVFTSAASSVSGRTLDTSGKAVANTRVTIQNTNTLEKQTVITNSFGNYRFDNLRSGDFYIITVSNKRRSFSQNTQVFTLNEALENLDFIADEM